VASLPSAPPYEIIVNFTNKVFRRLIGTLPMVGYERLVRRDVVGLCYHLVSHECPPHVAHLGAFKPLEMFEADLKYLKQHYNVISYEELLRRRQTATNHSLKKVSGTFCRNGLGALHKRFLTPFSTPLSGRTTNVTGPPQTQFPFKTIRTAAPVHVMVRRMHRERMLIVIGPR